MNTAQNDVDGLKKAYYENDGEELWDSFERVMHGAGKEDLEQLRTVYPDSLLQLLEIVDGTSQLFIDFLPSAEGKKGQIVRYLHDPDELVIIADSFDEYLQMLMENEYDFINEDSLDGWD